MANQSASLLPVKHFRSLLYINDRPWQPFWIRPSISIAIKYFIQSSVLGNDRLPNLHLKFLYIFGEQFFPLEMPVVLSGWNAEVEWEVFPKKYAYLYYFQFRWKWIIGNLIVDHILKLPNIHFHLNKKYSNGYSHHSEAIQRFLKKGMPKFFRVKIPSRCYKVYNLDLSTPHFFKFYRNFEKKLNIFCCNLRYVRNKISTHTVFENSLLIRRILLEVFNPRPKMILDRYS